MENQTENYFSWIFHAELYPKKKQKTHTVGI